MTEDEQRHWDRAWELHKRTLPGRPDPVPDLERGRRACFCECNSGGFCGGCGHAGCGGR